jgi:hypothetical protein
MEGIGDYNTLGTRIRNNKFRFPGVPDRVFVSLTKPVCALFCHTHNPKAMASAEYLFLVVVVASQSPPLTRVAVCDSEPPITVQKARGPALPTAAVGSQYPLNQS